MFLMLALSCREDSVQGAARTAEAHLHSLPGGDLDLAQVVWQAGTLIATPIQ